MLTRCSQQKNVLTNCNNSLSWPCKGCRRRSWLCCIWRWVGGLGWASGTTCRSCRSSRWPWQRESPVQCWGMSGRTTGRVKSDSIHSKTTFYSTTWQRGPILMKQVQPQERCGMSLGARTVWTSPYGRISPTLFQFVCCCITRHKWSHHTGKCDTAASLCISRVKPETALLLKKESWKGGCDTRLMSH